jgi:hypothetical protein
MMKKWVALLMICALAISAGCTGQVPSGSASVSPANTLKATATPAAAKTPAPTPTPLPDAGTLIAQFDVSKGMVLTWAPFVTDFTCTIERRDSVGTAFRTLSTVKSEAGTYVDTVPGDGGAKPVYRLCVSDGTRKAYSQEAQGEVAFEVGNTGGNLQNGGLTCESGGILYRIGIQGDVIGIYKVTEAGEATLVVAGIASQLNVANGFLYYVSQATGGLYRIVLPDGDPELVCRDKLLFALVVDDRIYATLADGGALIVMDGDGSSRETLVPKGCYDIGLDGQTLYYTNTASGEFCMRNLTSAKTTSFPMSGRCYAQMFNGRVYYQDENNGKRLTSCTSEGGDVQVLTEVAATGLNVTSRGIYFINKDDGNTPYRVALDGTGAQQLASVSGDYTSVLGDDLLLIDAAGKFYQIRDDGTVIRLYG